MKKIILLILFILFTSCGTLQWDLSEEYNIDRGYYNYNQIHHIYLNDPWWFYDNYYINNYGYYPRPFFIKYKKLQKSRRYNVNRRNKRSVSPTRSTNVKMLTPDQPKTNNKRITPQIKRVNSQIKRTPIKRNKKRK